MQIPPITYNYIARIRTPVAWCIRTRYAKNELSRFSGSSLCTLDPGVDPDIGDCMLCLLGYPHVFNYAVIPTAPVLATRNV